MFYLHAFPSRLLVVGATALRRVRLSPARLAKAAYLLVFSFIVSLLIAPSLSRGQFRGTPHFPGVPGVPFPTAFPAITGSFTGIQNPTLMTPTFPAIPSIIGLPGPPLRFPLNNLLTDSTAGFFSVSFSSGASSFGGLGIVGQGGFGGVSMFGLAGVNGFSASSNFGSITGFGLSGAGFGTSFGGITGVGGGFGGIGGATPFGGVGVGGFAGKGFGGFNGHKGL
jgi:hypothetical protein